MRFVVVSQTIAGCSGVFVCACLSLLLLYIHWWVGWPDYLSLCVSVFVAACLLVSVCNAAFLLCGVHLSRAECWVGLNPGDIHWRDTLRCHYPCGEAHHHPAAERHSARQAWKTAGETATAILRLRENCDDHAKKKNPTTIQKEGDIESFHLYQCLHYELILKPTENVSIVASNSEIRLPTPSNHSEPCERIPGINWNV